MNGASRLPLFVGEDVIFTPEVNRIQLEQRTTTGVHSIGYILRYTLYHVHYTMYNVQCTMYSVQCTVYNVQCTVYNVQCTMYSVQCTVYSVQCTMYNVHCITQRVAASWFNWIFNKMICKSCNGCVDEYVLH